MVRFNRTYTIKVIRKSGPDSPNWNGGKTTCRGYVYIYKPDHPFATKNGCVLEHRLVMEEHLGRFLSPRKWIIHHKNGIRSDNRIENLELMTKSQHSTHHAIIQHKK